MGLRVEGVEKSYEAGSWLSRNTQHVILNVSFTCESGECLGIIGESGSGKSTLGRLLLGVEKPDQGRVLLNGENVVNRRARLGKMSVVFQDYRSSIHPFLTVEQAIMEPLTLTNQHDKKKVDSLLTQVGLPLSYKQKYPHELSGGEVQRVCIARAISTEPSCILFDEAISSLDVSIQVHILDLLKELKTRYNMSYIFITHDLQAAAYMCDRLLILKDGQVEETVAVEELRHVQSPYAKKLLNTLITF
ncbi:ABC transporter ATP-binding protein [Metabacillus iocasae]|uniref:Nickel transport system ATP-binding protein n=1 Tax=Priestia iocasae TaxID=2291674 RepID=A0ABS2QSF5_9BACI|nr:ABC transporter ATP-binding protein [Metabacillus iocasae]MBM7702359.1 nickel transport system ATP-binding protein [Metabacillus iocasae]